MVDKENHFSSFFMMLLSATSLVVILSNFFSGNFSHRSSAKMDQSMPVIEDEIYMEEEPVYEEGVEDVTPQEFPDETNDEVMLEEGTFLEGSEELMNADEEDVIAQ